MPVRGCRCACAVLPMKTKKAASAPWELEAHAVTDAPFVMSASSAPPAFFLVAAVVVTVSD